MNNLVIIVLIFLVILNLTVSLFVLNRNDLETNQKSLQILIIWLIPLLAAIGIYIFYLSQDKKAKPFQREFGGGSSTSIGQTGNGGSD